MATNADGAFWAPISSIFDFTLKFEETIFDIAVSSVVAIFAVFLFRHYYKQPVVARGGILLWTKLVSLVLCWANPSD